jgi:hypothetical protein
MKLNSAKQLPPIVMALALCVAAVTLSSCEQDAEAAPADIGESIVVSSFSREYQDFELAIDTGFSKEVMEKLSLPGDDPATGFRTAGSPAEAEASVTVETAMLRAGLRNVTRDPAPVDSWTFKGANLIFENKKGGQTKISLGGYPANLIAEKQALMLVDLGGGKAADYAGRDVRGKLVLMEAGDTDEDGGFRAVQAKMAGAKAIIFCRDAGAGTEDRLLSGRFGAPSDAPAFAVSENDLALLKSALKRAENGELPVIFSSDSVVAGGAPTENIWGEIPGKSSETIYMLSNYDGFYHAAFEGASGLSVMLGVAKALCDSGFLPNRTIRFVACGAGEWGAANTAFDWGAGAWRQISRVRPEWAEQAFAVLNADAVYPFRNKFSFGMTASDEIYDFAYRSAGQLIETGMYSFTWYPSVNPSGIMTEDGIWNLFGIPSVAARPGDGEEGFYRDYRRSNMDTVETMGFDDDSYRFAQLLFGKLIMDMDETPVRPLDFEACLRAVLSSLETLPVSGVRLANGLSAAAENAAELTAATNAINAKYLESDAETRIRLSGAAANLNREFYALNRIMRDVFARFDMNGMPVLPHVEAGANMDFLNAALEALNRGDAAGAEEALKNVGFGRYADYGAPVCDYFAAQDGAGTWAAGRRTGPVCRADTVIRSLRQKLADGDPDLSAEIGETDALLAREELLLREILDEELSRTEEIAMRISKALGDASQLAEAGD